MNLTELLKSQKTFRLLLLINLLTGIAIFFLFKNQTGGDTKTYTGLADGILHGQYSYWYFSGEYYPDTFRNPGYPLLLTIFRSITTSLLPIQFFQLVLYFMSVGMILKIIDRLYNSVTIKNLFLLFLIPSIHVASYAPTIFPEIPVTFLLLCVIWIDLTQPENSWKRFIWLGLLFGIIFQIRPVILFIPFLFVAFKWITNRAAFSPIKNIVMLAIFIVTMLPYGMWNKAHHGVFKVTSLEGGGGVFHLGYWAFKLPDYYEPRYWGNYCTREMISFIDENDREGYIAEYNREWDEIDAATAPLVTAKDSAMIELQMQYPSLFKTYGSAYTLKRESLMKEHTLENIKDDLPYYIKTKFYSAIRLWVTGIPLKEFKTAGTAKKLYLAYPFFITLVTFLSALVLIPWAFRKEKIIRTQLTGILLLTLYFGLMHIPFTIQSRYTIPVRLELLMLLAVAVYFIFLRKKEKLS